MQFAVAIALQACRCIACWVVASLCVLPSEWVWLFQHCSMYCVLCSMEPISRIEHIQKERWELLCCICRQRMGAKIQCNDCYQVSTGAAASVVMHESMPCTPATQRMLHHTVSQNSMGNTCLCWWYLSSNSYMLKLHEVSVSVRTANAHPCCCLLGCVLPCLLCCRLTTHCVLAVLVFTWRWLSLVNQAVHYRLSHTARDTASHSRKKQV